MKVGTRSLLIGMHQWWFHPLMVLIGYRAIYRRFPRQIPEYFAILVHDWGYWGCPNMDGEEGKRHPWLGAWIMNHLFDLPHSSSWAEYTGGHSRFYAQRYGMSVSPLMRADKMATVLLPTWLFWLLMTIGGEKAEWVAYHQEWTGEKFPTAYHYAANLQADWMRRYGPHIDPGYLGGADDPEYEIHGQVDEFIRAVDTELDKGRR